MATPLTFDDLKDHVAPGESFEKIVKQFEHECKELNVTPEDIANTLDWIIHNLTKRDFNERVEIAPDISAQLAEAYDEQHGQLCADCIGEVNVWGYASIFIKGPPSGNKVVEGDENSTLIGNILPHYIRAHHFPEGTVRYGLKTEFLANIVKNVKIPSLMDRLNSGELILMDGAIGTNKMAGMHLSDIHQRFYDNGSIVSDTDTLTANPLRMSQERRNVKECKSLNFEAVNEAKWIRGTNYIRGSIGPQSEMMQPFGTLTERDIREAYNIQIDALVRIGGVHCLSLETCFDPDPTRVVTDLAMEYKLPVMVSFAVESPDSEPNKLVTPYAPFDKIFDRFRDVPIIGVNCCSPKDALEFLRQYRNKTDQYLMVEPNAGRAILRELKTTFPLNQEDFGKFAKEAKNMGANLIGGCCGTTPDHILYAAQALGIR